nr:lamin tail domain-containing protein [Paenibacillus turpanensis]
MFVHTLHRKVYASLVAATLLMGSMVPAANAEGPLDPAPELQPMGTANGKKVLFDNTHGQTAGAADWVIDGAFSDFANALATNGYYVKELRKTTPITYNDLSSYDVFIIAEANTPYKTTEQAAMLQYVQNGGSIFFISDHYNADRNKNRWDASEAFNGYRRGAWSNPAQGMSAEESSSAAMQDVSSSDWLGSNFGVRFRYNAIGNVVANDIVEPSQSFNITQGVSAVAMHAGSTLAITDPQKAKGIVYLPSTTAAWSHAVDQGVYEGGGRNEGPYAAVSKVGAGKAAFIGDSSPVEDATPKYLREETGGSKKTYDGFKEQDDGVLLVNMVNWLATKESYTSLSQVNGLQLDPVTTLLSMENPSTSTEPQAEPWSAPSAGYNWWDTCTFKSGSYGYGYCNGNGGGGGTGGGGDGSGGGTGDLFFSEYVEGSSYNKALEIYNGTGAAVNLSSYTITQSNTTSVISLNGTLQHGDVYVLAHPSASSSIRNSADTTSSSISFNGDDAITLKKSGVVIDVIGTAGTSFGTDLTLIRKGTVTSGTASYNSAEWDAQSKDTTSNLGIHTTTSSNHAPIAASPIADQTATLGGSAVVIDATNTFSDADGDPLTLTASSSNSGIAKVAVSGKQLTVTPVSAGTASITVTANDGRGGSVNDSFTVNVVAVSAAQLDETFETGSKDSYTNGNVTLSSGSWAFHNALIGGLSSDKKNGTKAARIRATGSLAMNFNVSAAKEIKLHVANFGSDTGATWKLQKSVDNGATWTDVTSAAAATSSLTEKSISVNETSAVRFQIVVSGTTGQRLNIDHVRIMN